MTASVLLVHGDDGFGLDTAVADFAAEVGATDPLTQRIYDSYMDFRARSIEWGAIADQGYYNARSLPFQYG